MSKMPVMAKPEEKQAGLAEIFLTFFKMGLTAFGPAMMAETKKNIVKRKKLLNEQEFLNGLALAQFLPGATFVTLTVFMGYRIRRLAGAAASFFGFLLPPTALMVILSYLYFRYSGVPWVESAFTGLEALVVALIANAVFSFSYWRLSSALSFTGHGKRPRPNSLIKSVLPRILTSAISSFLWSLLRC